MQQLQTIPNQHRGQYNPKILLNIIQCYAKNGRCKEALESLNQFESDADFAQHQNLPTNLVNDCYDSFLDLVKSFIEIQLFESAVFLQQSLFSLIKLYFEGKSRACKLSFLSIPMKSIATALHSQKHDVQFKTYYEFMDQILSELHKISNIDVEYKCEKIASFLYYYGWCCKEINDHIQAIAHNSSAICAIKLVFANNASNFRLLGYCHHNLAVAYKNLNQLEKALFYLKKALAIKTNATDFSDDIKKEESMLLTKTLVEKILSQLKSKN